MTRLIPAANCHRTDAPHFARAATPAAMVLRESQSFRVVASDGSPLVEVFVDEHGPVVRLGSRDVRLDFPGHLQISAGSLTLAAHEGELRLEADEDTVVRGKTIRLN